MNEITVTLKNGKEVVFQTEINVSDVKRHCDDMEVIPTDHAGIYIDRGEIAAIQSQPLAKCPSCGKWVSPEEQTVVCGGKVVDTAYNCPECNAEITEVPYD